jgi:hypothetical protein
VGFDSRRGHGCLSVVSVVCCQVEVSATSWSFVQRSPTDCGVSECDRAASIMRGPWPTKLLRPWRWGMYFVSTANLIRPRTEICGELEAVMMFNSRNYLAVLLELLLFRYLNLLHDKYNLAHYNYIRSKCGKSRWPCKTVTFFFASEQAYFVRDLVLSWPCSWTY